MSHSYTCLLYHFVFATEGRLPLVPVGWIPEVRRFTRGILENHNSKLIAANGTADHLHILASLHASLSVSKGVQVIKSNTSRWLAQEKGLRPFAWQEGYGGFTVSRSQRDRVRRYIDGQKEHHLRRTFEAEIRALFDVHDMRFPNDWFPD